MKRISALMLALLMCFSVLVACGKSEEPAATTTAATDAAGNDDTTAAVTEETEPVEELEITVKPEYAGKVINILCRGHNRA